MDRELMLREMTRTIDELRVFNEIGKTLTSTLNVKEVLAIIMEKISQLLKPTNWSLLLVDEASQELVFEIVVGDGAEKLKDVRLPLGEGVVGWVAREAKPILVADAREEERWNNKLDNLTNFSTRSILCVPLVSRGNVLGVVELVNSEPHAFSEADARLLNTLADYAAIAIENARNFQRVQDLTVADDVTGLYNSRFMHETLDTEFERARRYGQSFALVFLDLDHFKQVNDNYGHLCGSRLLCEVGGVIKAQVRQVDVATRYGGDEFVLVLPQTTKEQALHVTRRLRLALNDHVFLREQGLEVHITASFGVASYPEDSLDREEILRLADEAMYRVKETTRDGIQVAASRPKDEDTQAAPPPDAQ